ncbi:hypothetical protein V8F06_013545 [Rhypophila decipiens]
MHFSKIVTLAVATVATATPTALSAREENAMEKRGFLVVICEVLCASVCGVGSPLACLACAAACLETAVPGEPVDINAVKAKSDELVAALEESSTFSAEVTAA